MYEVVQGFRLSPQQRRLWQWQQKDAAFRSWCVVRIDGPLDLSILRRAVQSVISRHEVLRTLFHCPADVSLPLQRIVDESVPAWRVEDLTTLTSEEQQARIEELVQASAPFDLEHGPLLRIECLKLSGSSHALLVTLPSLCADGLTLRNIVHELARCYTACRYESDGLPEPTQYVQFSEWQNELQEEDDESGKNYWRRFKGASLPATLPYERKSRATAEFAFSSVRRCLPSDLDTDFLLACWQTLMWRLTGAQSIVIGVQFDGRKYDELIESLGLFAKCLPVQQNFADDPRFSEILESVTESCRDASAWQEYFNWEDCFASKPSQDFFPVHFSFEEWPKSEDAGELQFNIARHFTCIEPYKLKLACVQSGDSVSAELHFDANSFSREHAQLIARCFETLVQSAHANPDWRASEFEIVSEHDAQQLLAWSKSQVADYPQQCIQGLFEEQAGRTPDASAVVYDGRQLTYAELNARANQLAHFLRRHGVGPNVIVGLCVRRSLEMMVGVWGILKAGGAYLPLDPEHPPARVGYQLSQGRCPILLTQEAFADLVPEFEGEVVCLDKDWNAIAKQSAENPASVSSSSDLAYVIFTSGSTGRPKGVEVTHRNLVNYAWSVSHALGINEALRFANVSTLSADLGNTAIYISLITGGALHILDYEVATDGEKFADYLIEQSIDAIKIVPSHLNALLPSLKMRNTFPLKYAVIGGEALSFDLVKSILDLGDCRIVNHYGPTEATVGCVIYPVDQAQACETLDTSVPIGRPIANMEVHILDERQRPVPPGLAGELCVGGVGLAKGYLNQPEQTEARFIRNPFSSDLAARLYRTGDLARYLPDGNIEFIGRVDHQVKIRGYRIELAEIENALLAHANVREAVVQAREDEHGHKHLVAYCVPQHEPAPNSAELTNALKHKLPAYMVPQIFINLKSLPLTKNGKVAREKLPEPHFGSRTAERALPQTDVEKKLAAIWTEVLGVKEVGTHDSFFEMGGDSVLSIQIIARARQAGLAISPKHVFDHPTIAELAQVAGTITAPIIDQGPVTGELPLLPIQQWFFERELPEPHHYNQAILLEVKRPLEISAVQQIVRELLVHHDALRTRFVREASGWRQFIPAPDESVPLVNVDLSDVRDEEIGAAIEAESARLQTSFDLATGPLVRVAYFDLGAGRAPRLLLVFHHLVIDGVSWRVLVEDLVLAWEMAGRHEQIELPARTTSFKTWAERLAAHARSKEFQTEASYWLKDARQAAKPLPTDHANAPNTLASAHTVTTNLDSQQTHALLYEVSEAYHTQINDLLLTALAQACSRWTGNQSLLIDLEGHGREPLFDDVDVSRTVGWFTTHFPVLLKAEEKTGEAVRTVKEQLRQIPNRGIGYGMFRYLSDDAAIVEQFKSLPQPEVSFNYLGQFDQVLPENAPFKLAPEGVGETQSRRGDLSYLLRVNASVSGGELQVLWTYSRNVFEQTTIERLGQEFMRALQVLISDCLSVQSASYTPSDFPDADLSQKDLDAIFTKLKANNVEDIYTLSPMQEGMLFQSLYNREGDSYFRQMSFVLHGELSVAGFEQAWRQVVERHPTLRTSFFWRGTDRPVQVVQREVPLPLDVLDWRELSPEQQQEKLQTYLHEQQTRPFDLEQAPLIHLALIRLEDRAYRFVWSYHHILIDGWSRALIFKDVLALYEAFATGREAELEPRRPFRDYIRWLRRQDLAKAEVYWREKLKGFVLPPPLADVAGPESSDTGDFTKVLSRELSAELTNSLQAVARQHQLTVNTLVQGAWALVLTRLTGVSDVAFGVVASGRAIDLPGSEAMIGPFLNTLPLRIQLSSTESLVEWLRKIQQQQQELREFEHSPLSEVQRWSDAPRGKALFETVVNFTNYFVDSSLRRRNELIEVRDPSIVERVHYAMVLEAEPGPTLRILLLHDSRRFDAEVIDDVLGQVESVLAMMASGADRHVGDLQPGEKAQLPQLPTSMEQQHEYALSYHQERLWFIDQFEKGNVYETSPTYHNIPLVLHLDGPIDVELLEASLDAVVNRHEALRTRIVTKDANTQQVVTQGQTLKLNVVEAPAERMLEVALEDSRRPFTIDEDHLVRATLVRGNAEESILVVTVHHILADKQSLQLVAEELAEIYTAHSERRTPQLPDPAVQYPQYSEWQLGLGKDVLDPLLSYWKRQLGGELRALELPEDRTRPAVHTYTAASTGFSLNKRFARRMEQLCLQERSTAFAIVLAAFKALLHRYANQDEIIVGTTAPCRNQPGTEELVGPIANLLVLRSNTNGNPAFRSFLAQVTKTVEQAYRHQEMPFDKLVLELNPQKDMSRTALFDVLFNFETEESGELDLGDTTARIVDTNLGWGKYDLNMLMRRSTQGLSGTVVYNSDIYNDTTIEQMMRHFEVMLEAVIANPDRNIDDVVLLSEAEEQQQLVAWNETQATYPVDKTIHQLFEIQAQKTPEKIAIVDGEESLTYRELDERANRFADVLQNQGVGPDVLVAVLLDKSAKMIVALLGILKAGGAYLPLNAEFPEERLRFILEDSRTSHLVTSERAANNIAELVANVIYVDRDYAGAATEGRAYNSPENIAYCIYTSGSTGKPKGVLVEHRNVVRLMLNDKHQFDFSENDVWTMFHSYSFDFSVWEMYGALLYGGKLVIVPEEQMKDPLLFLDLLAEQRVTVLNQTPSAFNNLAIEALKRSETNLALRYVIFGGEELHPIQLQEWRAAYPNVKLINMYGITETTVHVTFKEITEREIEANISNIGVPIPTTTTYVFDSKLKLLPVGVPGEVCVGGLGVSRGYLDRDELTRQKFIANPYKPEERIYRSGDLAKLLPNGEMVYLGRIDDQVQIRGFRVELGEVSSHLLEHPSVAKAEIVARRSQADLVELVAYVEPSSEVSVTDLRHHLAHRLPYYMVPSAFVILKTLPMTPNGKVDRKALPPPNATRETDVAESRLNMIQEVVAAIWAEVLEIDRVEPTDNFLELGGHSLMATRVFSRIRDAFQVELPLRTLFDAPVLTELAAVIEKAMKSDTESSDPPLVPVPRDRDLPTSFGQHGLWLVNRLEPDSHIYNLPFALRLKGNLNIAALERSLVTLTERHETLRTTFKAHNGQPRQVISPVANTQLVKRDLRHLPATERDAEAHRLAVQEAQKPFDLERGPLLKTVLLQLDDDEYVLLFNTHHIITDGWSLELMSREVGNLYDAYSRGVSPALPELPVQYADYAVWQRESLRGERLDNQLSYWRRQLEGMQTLRLPTQRPAARTDRGASHNIRLPLSLAASLRTLSRREGVTLFITMLAAFKTLLYRYTGQEDIVVGTPMTNRGRRELENLIGYFVSMVPLRTDVSGNPTFRELLTRVRHTTLGAYAHQEVPLQKLLKELQVEREGSRAIPFPAVFVLQNTPIPFELPDITLSAVDIFKQTAPADLYLAATEVNDGLVMGFKYSLDLFGDKIIAELLANFAGVLEAVVAQPDCRLLEIPFREGSGASTEASEKARAYHADQFAF